MAEPDPTVPPEGGSPPPAEGGEPSPPASPDPLDQKLSALEGRLSQTFADRLAAIEARLTASAAPPPPPATPTSPAWYDSEEGIERAYTNNEISDVQRIQAHARLQSLHIAQQQSHLTARTQRDQTASAEFREFVALEPALSKPDSPVVKQVWQAVQRLASRGLGEFDANNQPTLATQVQAIEMVLGSLEALRAKRALNDYTSGRRPTAGLPGGPGSEPGRPASPTDPYERLTDEGKQFYAQSGYSPDDVRRFIGKHADDHWWGRMVANGMARR